MYDLNHCNIYTSTMRHVRKGKVRITINNTNDVRGLESFSHPKTSFLKFHN